MNQPDAPILTPDARTVAYFLTIAEGTALLRDAAADAWLTEHGLISTASGVLAVTARGAAWGGMLVATPLPVEVSRWADPRGGEAVKVDASTAARGELLSLLRELTKPAAPVAASGARPAPASDLSGVDPLPGFMSNRFTTLKLGETPAGMQRDDQVVVQYRNGTIGGERPILVAGQVRWGWRDVPDPFDVLYFRQMPREDGDVSIQKS